MARVLLLAVTGALGQGRAMAEEPKALKSSYQLQTEHKLAEARKGGDPVAVVHALIAAARARGGPGVDNVEESVRFLREQAWPEQPGLRMVLHLFSARNLIFYAQSGHHEFLARNRLRRRDGGPVTLPNMTPEEVIAEGHRILAEAWRERERLGSEPASSLAGFFPPDGHPPEARPTTRDLLSYQLVRLFADSSWVLRMRRDAVLRLDVDLLKDGAPAVDLASPDVSASLKGLTVLADLEAWHRASGRREAALEARLERTLSLAYQSSGEAQARILQNLSEYLEGSRDVPGWSLGMFRLAELEKRVGHLERALAAAQAGARAWPGSPGAKACQGLAETLAPPSLAMKVMNGDGPRRRSIELTHRNVSTVYFRAYAFDLEPWLLSRKGDADLQVREWKHDRMRHALRKERRVATWTTQLPAATDLREHRTYVVPPLDAHGTYLIVASLDPGPDVAPDRMWTALMTVTPWVVSVHPGKPPTLEVRVVDGRTGRPAGSVGVRLLSGSEVHGFEEVARGRTDARGDLQFRIHEGEERQGPYHVLVGFKREAVLHPERMEPHPLEEEPDSNEPRHEALVFTDRTVYRPGQTLRWKVVGLRIHKLRRQSEAAPDLPVEVWLVNPADGAVEKRVVRTGASGSVSGEFTLPANALPGSWGVQTRPQGGVRVHVLEEEDAPTFDVALQAPDVPPTLGRPATVRVTTQRRSGAPVAGGVVRWRLHRELVLAEGQTSPDPGEPGPAWVADGLATLAADGSLPVTFTPLPDDGIPVAPGRRWHFRLEVDVTAAGKETRTARHAFRVGPTTLEARVELEAGFFREGAAPTARLMRASLEGAPRPGPGTWKLVALKQPAAPVMPAEEPAPEPLPPPFEHADAARTPTPGDRMQPRWRQAYSSEDTLRQWADGAQLAAGVVEHGPEGLAQVRLPALKAGAYRLHYETRDALGQRVAVARELLVAGRRVPVALPVALVPERPEVRVGQVARLLAFSGFEGQSLQLEVFHLAQRVERRVLSDRWDSPVVEVPVTEALRGGFTVVLTAVRDWQVMSLHQFIPVRTGHEALDLELDIPGAGAPWKVKARPEGAELTVSVYPRALDGLMEPPFPWVSRLHSQTEGRVYTRHSQVPVSAAQLESRGGPGDYWPRLKDGTLDFNLLIRPSFAKLDPRLQAQLAELERGDRPTFYEPYLMPPRPPPLDTRLPRLPETALWVPRLATGPDGTALLEAPTLDGVEEWSVWVHGFTPEGGSAFIRRTVKAGAGP